MNWISLKSKAQFASRSDTELFGPSPNLAKHSWKEEAEIIVNYMNHNERQNQTVEVVPVIDAWRGLAHLTGGLLFALRRPQFGHGLLLIDHFHVVTMLRLTVRLFRKFEKFVRAVASAILLFGFRRINRSGSPLDLNRFTIDEPSRSSRRASYAIVGFQY